MAKVLLIDGDLYRRVQLQAALTAAGYEISCAPTGSFALTMVERDRPDLIVSRAQVQDMDGFELCAILRADPLTQETPFLLLADCATVSPEARAQVGVDMVLLGSSGPARVLHWVGTLLRRKALAAWAAGAARRGAAWQAALQLATAFHGSLTVTDLNEVTQLIASGRKTGRLILSLAAGEGVIVFDAGSLVHAWFDGETGEAACKALALAARREGAGNFCFFTANGAGAPPIRKTIHTRWEELLGIAREMDEGRSAGGNGRGGANGSLAGKGA